jgi:hypothetical protein
LFAYSPHPIDMIANKTTTINKVGIGRSGVTDRREEMEHQFTNKTISGIEATRRQLADSPDLCKLE